MKQLLKKIKQISMLLLVISLIGCEDDAIMPEVISDFTYTINTDTGTVTFINKSVNTKNYFWSFGDETSSTEINPIKTYPETGNYIVSLKATDVSGASNTFIDTLGILIKEAMSLPVTFDDVTVKYEATVFNGASFEIVENPDVSGSNNKASNVGAITNSGAAYEGINFDLETPIDFTLDKTIAMNVWADASVDVLMKLEEGTGANIEVNSSHTGTGWERIEFDFNSSEKYSRLTLFVDGPGTTAGTFYIDDIVLVKSAPVITLNGDNPMSVEIGSTYEEPGAMAVDGYNEDISSNIIIGGDTVDTNTAGTYVITYNVSDDGIAAAEVTRTVIVAADTEAPVITLNGDATMNISVGDTFTDPGATATDNIDGDITANIVVAGDAVDVNTAGTYTITYNVSDAAGNAATEVTRDVEVAPTCSDTLLELPIDFDCDGIDYVSKDTGDVAFEVIDNPELSGINATPSKVAKLVFDANQQWENMNLNLDTPISFATDKSVKLKLFSSTARAVKLKFETGGAAVENDQNHTGSGWEELTFTIASAESYSNLILFVDGGSDTTGVFYVDDIEQVTDVAGPSGAYFYSTAGTVDIVTVWGLWDTDTTQDGAYDQDATYNPCIKLSGTGWGTLIAFTEFPAGTMAEYGNLEFKIKSDEAEFKIKVPEEEKTFAIAEYGTPLEGGWVQISIPLSTWSTGVINAATQFAIWGGAGTTLYLTDVMLSGDGGGTPPPSDCPEPPAGDLISNGDFEAGESCWQLIDNGGSVTISSTESSGSGTKSGQIQTAPLKNPGIKQERFAVGTALPNTEYVVTFDIKADASTPLADGAVFKAFVFSEGLDGGTTPASLHILEGGLGSVSTSWETKTYTFMSGASAANVEGGFSFLAELVCGGAATCSGIINIDNVSIKLK